MPDDPETPLDKSDLEAANRVRRAQELSLTPGQRIEQAAALIRQAQAFTLRDDQRSR
jgi:hypothetical protein